MRINSCFWRFSLLACCLVGCNACGADSPASPAPVVAAPVVTAPPPIAAASITWIEAQGSYGCFTGLCNLLTVPVVNLGPGCATNVQVTIRAFGSDGNGIQLGIDIPMGLPGGSLATLYWPSGSTFTLQNISPFNDVRSAHTVFKIFPTWTNVACR